MDTVSFDNVFQKDKFEQMIKAGFLIDINNVGDYEKKIKSYKSAIPDTNFWSGKRVIVTGAAGMVGSTIIDLLLSLGARVYGTIKRHSINTYPNISHLVDSDKIKTLEVDLRDYGRVASLVKEIEPHVIFHQAAESFVPTSLQQPTHVVENNCVSTVNLLEAATKTDRGLEGIQVACSSEQYGFVKDIRELPINELNELRPTSTYAATKTFTEYISKSYYYMYKTPTIITRTFNQEGPKRGPQFFTARVATQIAQCLKSKLNKVIIGNPNAVRDFTHVYDSALAQVLAVEKVNKGEAYNVCSSIGITTGHYTKLAMKTFGLENRIDLLVDKNLLRPYERGEALFDGFVGDNKKFVEKTGWRPSKTVVDIIKDSVDFFMKA